MLTKAKFSVARWFLAIMCFASLSAWGQSKVITLAAIDYPPYYAEFLPNKGPLAQISRRAFSLAGYDLKLVFIPWIRAVMWSKEGKIHGVLGAWKTEERKEHFLFSTPVYPNQSVFYKRKKQSISYQNFEDLKQGGYMLGSVLGYEQPSGLVESGIDILYVTQDTQPFKLLSKGRVDLIVVDKDYAQYVLSQEAFSSIASDIEPMERVIEQRQQHLMLSRATPNAQHILQAYNKGLQQLRESGEFDQILISHGLLPQSSPTH